MCKCTMCRRGPTPRSKVKTACQKWSANFRPKWGGKLANFGPKWWVKLAKLGFLGELRVERAEVPGGQLWAGLGPGGEELTCGL